MRAALFRVDRRTAAIEYVRAYVRTYTHM